MAASFNLTAQLNLRGPSNIRNIVSNIRRQLGTISGDINFNINPATTRNVTQLNAALQGLNQTFAQTATAARNASTAIAAFSNAANAGNINNVATNLNNVSAAANNTAQSVTRASRQTAVARTEMEEFGRQSALAIRRFAAFSVSTGAVVGLTNAIRKGIASFIEYDRQLVVLQQVTGESANGLAKLSGTITSLSTGLGVASADLLSVSSTLAQAGLSARDTERALKALALSALAPSFDNLNKTVEGSVALMRQFGISAKDLEASLGSVNAVAAAFAVESGDIIAAIQRTGGVFAAASKGVSEGTQALNEFVAIFTSVRQTTRESAETIATGLRTIFTRIQRGGTIEALKEFGVNLTDVEGKFVGAYRAVQLLSEGLNRIDPRDIKFSQIVEELGGFRQIGKVIPLIQQFSVAQRALAVAQAGAGSLAEDAAIAQLSLANQITKVREEFLALFREIGSSDSFQTIARGALDVASALIRVADSVKGVLPVLGIMMAMRGASAITQFGAGFLGGIRRGGGAAGLGGRMAGGFASGGYVPGSGNRDTVPAMLTPGEFVIRKKAVEKIGVGRLARLNRNGGGPIPTQYFNDGGQVQKFADGQFVMPKARGVKGARGARGPKGFQPLSSSEYAKWSREIYTQWESDSSLPWHRYMGISMPKPIAEYQKKVAKYTFETGGAGLALGRDAKGREVIAKFGRVKEQQEKLGSLKKTQGALTFSAAGLQRGPRAPAGQMEKALAKYQQDPEYQRAMGSTTSSLFDTIRGPLAAFKKGGTFGGVITPGSSNAQKIKDALSKLQAQSSGADAAKAKTAIEKFDSFIAGATPEKAGHVAHFTWAMNQIFKKGLANFAKGGMATAPMVDDILQTSGAILPRPSAVEALIKAGGGAVDIDRTLKRTLGDKAYARATTSEAQKTVLDKYFSDDAARLRDIKAAPLTTFGKALKEAIQSGQLRANRVSIISKSRRTRGVPEYLSQLFGIPVQNMVFTQGGTKQPAIDAMRTKGPRIDRVKRFNFGGLVQKFKYGKEVQKVDPDIRARAEAAGGFEQLIEQNMRPGGAALRFGLVGLQSGTSKGNRVERKKIQDKEVRIHVGILPDQQPNEKTTIEQDITRGLKGIINKTGNRLSNRLSAGKIPSNKQQVLDGAVLSSATGSIYEAALQTVGAPFVDKIESIKSIDFPFGLGPAAQLFNNFPPTIPTDATRTIAGSGKGISDFTGQIGRFFNAMENKEFTKQLSPAPSVLDRLSGGSFSAKKAAKLNSIMNQNGIRVSFGAGKKLLKAGREVLSKSLPGNSKAIKELEDALAEELASGGFVAQRFATGGLAEAMPQMSGLMRGLYGQRTAQQKQPQQDKKPKDFGKIGLRSSGSEITATYFKNQTREGFVSAKKAAGNLFTIGLSKATKGYGPRLYDIVMEAATAQGGMLTSDRNQVSDAAKSVWAYYFNNRGDVRKTPLDPSQWTKNQAMIDPKLYGKKETWPPPTDPAWILQSGYSKAPTLINSPEVMNLNDPKYAAYIRQQQTSFLTRNSGGSISRFANGGSAQDTVPALLTPGEFVINKKAAKRIGSARLHRLNKADKISGFNKGGSVGGVQKFAVGGAVDTAISGMSAKDATRLKAAVQKNAQAFEQLERMVGGWPVEQVGIAIKKLERAMSRGAAASAALTDVDNQMAQLRAGGGAGPGASRIAKKGILQQSAGAPENRNITNPVGPRGFAASQARLNQIAQNTQQYNAGAAIVASRTTTSGMMGGQVQMSQAGQQYAASLQKNSGILNKLSQILGITSKTQQQVNQSSQRLAQAQTQAATAAAAGGGGGEDNKPSRMDRLKNAAFSLSFAVPMIADMMTVAEPKNAQQAETNARMTGLSTAVGSATMLASMGPLGVIAAIPTAVGGIIKAFADAKNAAHEFNKQAQSTKLEESLEKAGTALDNYSKNVKDTAAAEKARASVLKANQEAQTLSTMQQQPRSSMMGMIFENSTIERLLGTSSPDNMAMQRSQILEQKGIMSYLGSIGFGGGDAAATTSVEFRSLIPQLAKENAKTFQGAAEASTRLLETQFKSGQTVDSMAASGQLKEFGRSLALADVKVQEYMMAVDNTVGLSDAQKNAMKENIIATQTETKAREIQTRALREKALETLNRQTTQLQNSLERMFQNMEQAINSNAYSLTKLSDSAELTAASLSGAARAGAVRVDAINALNNPRGVSSQQRNAAVTQAASMFGSQAPEMEGVLKLSGMLENTLMSTINNTIKAANASGTAVTQEAIGAKLESSINQALSDLQLPPELATGLSREVKDAVQKMRTSGEDQVDFSEIINQVPQLGRVLESSRRAQELANKALEYWQQNLNEYANAMNNLVETQVDINSRLRRSTDILISGQLALGKALGQSVSLQTSVALIDQKRAAQTPGGVTDPNAIAMNIRNLETLRSTQEAQAQEAAQKGFGGKDEFVNMQNNLANTNLALRENYASLKDMSENTDKANAAMERISELRAKTQAGAGIAERLVTSSPQELANLNRSMALLNNNMRGGVNVGSTAEDRKGVLDVFNMIAPFLGERQDALKANVLESMLQESGIGVNNMMQGVLDSLRNPAADPQMAQAINIYNQGVNEQVKANQHLANLALIMNENNAEIAAQKIATAIQGVQLSFETQTLSNINDGIQTLVGIAQQKPPGNVAGAIGIAKGGIVYAAEGQHINFKTKGTDTVPAMLTPGEFVVNRAATQKNLPLLQSINNGYQRGGKVSYYQDGGLVFGGRWGLAKNMDAQSTINAGPELQSKEKLSGLNWNELFDISPISISSKTLPKNDRVGSVAGFVGFVGGTQTQALMDSVPIKNGSGGSFGGALPLFPAMYAYDKLTLRSRQIENSTSSRTLDISPREITSSPSLNIFDIPNLDFIQKVLSTSVNTPFSNRVKKPLLESITELYSSIPNIKDNGNSFTIGNRSVIKTANQSTETMTPTYRVSDTGKSLEVVVENLGKKQYFGSDILLDDTNILLDAQKRIHKSIAGVGMPIGVGVESNVAGYRRLNAGIGNSPVLRGTGFLWTGLGGENLWTEVYENLYNPVKLDVFSSMTGMDTASKLQQLVDFKARLKNAYEIVNKASFVESSASTGRKALINKMRNLLRGSSFKEMFDATEIAGGVPTTLFNLSDDIWSKFKFPNSPPGTYATNKSSWVPIGMLDMDGFFTFTKSFPWVREGFKDTDTIMSRKKEFIEKAGDLVKVRPANFDRPNMSFPYKEIIGPLWDAEKGTFTDKSDYKFNVIDTFGGARNPFNGLQLDTNTQAILADFPGGRGNIDAFVKNLLDSNDQTGKFKLNIASKLPQNDPFLSKADYTVNTKNNAFINALTKTMEFEPVEYKKILDKEKEKQRIAQRDQIAGQAAGAVEQAANFDAAKRVALGRLAYSVARKAKVPMRFRPPETFNDLSAISETLQQTIPNVGSDYVRTLTAGTKLIFDKLIKDDGSFFLQNGIDINTAFDPTKALRKKIRQPDGSFVDKIYAYNDIGGVKSQIPAQIQSLIMRSGFQERIGGLGANKSAGGGLTAVVSDEDKAGLNLKGIKIERVNPETGKLEEKPFIEAGEQVLKWGDLFDTAFNPYAQFPNIQGRQSLFSLFKEKFNTATMPGTRRPAFDKRLLAEMNRNLTLLSQWYGMYQDYLINTTDTPDISAQKKTKLDASTTIIKDRELAQDANRFYTNNKFGELPTYEWLQAKLDQKINPANTQPQQVVPQARASGGLIYASNGALINFQPRGTDTVPAMLTPGEFVVNRAATQKHLPLLKSINRARGGIVQYRQEGGMAYDASTGTFSRSETLASRILSKVESGNKLNDLTYNTTNKNLSLSKDTNSLATSINRDTSGLRSSVKKATGFAMGGMIYASKGQLINFQPKGTDTVPAMLTPGEFVVNRAATQKNLPLLKSINSGVGGYSSGGIIYAQDGTMVPRTRKPPQRGSLGRLVPLPGVPLSRESAPTAALPKSKPEIAKPKLPNSQPSSGKDSYVDWYLKKFKDIPDIESDDLDLMTNLGSIMNDKNAKEFGLSRSIISQGRIDFAGKTKSDIYKLIDSLLLPKISSARRIADLEYPEKIRRSQGPGPMGLRGGDLPVGLPPGTSGFGLAEGGGGWDDSYGGQRERYYRFIAITLSELNKEGITRVRSALKSVADFEYLESTDPLFEYRRDSPTSSTNMTGIMNSRVNDYSSIFDLEYLLSEAQAKQNKQISQTKIKSITDYISKNTDEGFGELPLQQAIDQTVAAYQKYNKFRQDIEDGVVGATHVDPPRPDINLGDSSPFSVIRILDGLIDDHQNVFEFLAKTPKQKAQYQFSRATILAKTKLFDLLSNSYISAFGGSSQTDSEERADFSVSRFGRNDVKTSTPNQPLRKWISLDGKKSVIGKMASIVDNTNTKNPVDYIEFLRAKRDNSGLEKVLVNIFKFSKFDQEYIHRVASSLQQKPNTFSSGGTVYASKGQLINFQPKGTDTVPAMLTPGEFVVNRSATQKNLPLLKAINNGVGGYSQGGIVYLANGGDIGEFPKFGPRRLDINNPQDQDANQLKDISRARIPPVIKNLLVGVLNNKSLYDIFNDNAIKEQFNNDNSYSDKLEALDQQKLAQEYQRALTRFNYLKSINLENEKLHKMLTEGKYARLLFQLRMQMKPIDIVDGKTLEEIFETQKTRSATEAKALKTAWEGIQNRFPGAVAGAQPLNKGGIVYANNGTLIPSKSFGLDTVPAMLTPGEFVINRDAAQKHLSLLHAINNNSFSQDSILTMNKGGYIQPSYLSRGGSAAASLASLPDMVSKIAGGIQNAVEKAITQAFNNIELPSQENNTGVSTNNEIATKMGSLATNLSNLANRLESISIPPEITIQGKQDINVNANGLQVLSSLNPSLSKIASNMIQTAINNLAAKNPGTLDFNIEYPQGQ